MRILSRTFYRAQLQQTLATHRASVVRRIECIGEAKFTIRANILPFHSCGVLNARSVYSTRPHQHTHTRAHANNVRLCMSVNNGYIPEYESRCYYALILLQRMWQMLEVYTIRRSMRKKCISAPSNIQSQHPSASTPGIKFNNNQHRRHTHTHARGTTFPIAVEIQRTQKHSSYSSAVLAHCMHSHTRSVRWFSMSEMLAHLGETDECN